MKSLILVKQQFRAVIKTLIYLLLYLLDRFLPVKIIPILLYHSIDDLDKEDCVHPATFYKQMRYLYKKGYNVLPLDKIIDFIESKNKEIPPKIVGITFDDGYRSIYKYAMPIIRKFNFPVTVFIPTDYIGMESKWSKPSLPLLTWYEIFEMKKSGVFFGSHGHFHRNMTVLDEESVKKELQLSKKFLEKNLRETIYYISYPYSQHNSFTDELVLKCGYRASFSVIAPEKKDINSGISIQRVSVLKEDNILAFRFFLSGKYLYYLRLRKILHL